MGIYLAVHFLHLLPWSFEVFGRNGLMKEPSLNGTYFLFPNILNLLNSSELLVQMFLILLAIAALILASGRFVLGASLTLWYGWACLFNSNNLILNPTLPYIGWLLLAVGYMSTRPNHIHKEIYTVAWFLLAVGYSVSGWAKLMSPSWQDGSALIKIINNPLARDYFFRDFLAALPPSLWKTLTWFTVGLELLFLPLSFFKSARFWIWTGMVALHLGILLVVSFADLTIGILIVHLFTIDYAWFQKLKLRRQSA